MDTLLSTLAGLLVLNTCVIVWLLYMQFTEKWTKSVLGKDDILGLNYLGLLTISFVLEAVFIIGLIVIYLVKIGVIK